MCFFCQAEDGIRAYDVTGVQTCALPICARAGKHVICEKPLGINVQQAHEMWAACRDAGLAGFVPFWTRYVPIYARAREIVQSGRLGDVRAVVYRWHNPRPTAMPLTWQIGRASCRERV